MFSPSSKQRVEAYEFAQFRLDLIVRQLFHLNKPIQLSSKAFDILKLLVENRGQVVTKEDLINHVWRNRVVEENNLTVRMSALRKALGESAENRFIETVPGYGYRFVVRVGEILSENSQWQEESLDSLAILPLSSEKDLQRLNYLCDGITESLISSLSHITNLRVMARSTVFRYKGQDVDPQKVGKELGVRAILVGNVSQQANSLLFDMELIDAKDGAYLWGAKYERQISDLVTLQEEITREITEKLRIKLNKIEENQIAKRYTDNPQAHHLYMKARYFLNKRSVSGVKKAIDYFRSTIRYDPKYALAFVGLADAYFIFWGYGLQPPRATIPKARSSALKALEIDKRLAEVHISLGNIKSNYELDWIGAESEYQLAIKLNPYNASAHQYYAYFLVKARRFDEAIVEAKKAHEIDPLSFAVNLLLVKIYYFSQQYDEAVKKGREILEMDPQFGPANGLIGMAYLELGRSQAAIREFKKGIGFSAGDYKVSRSKERNGDSISLPDSDPEAIAFLGYAYAVAGKRNKALQVLAELGSLNKRRYVQPHTLAMVYVGLRDKDKAFEWLERAVMDRTAAITYLNVWPFFDSLKSDLRFERLVRRIGLEP